MIEGDGRLKGQQTSRAQNQHCPNALLLELRQQMLLTVENKATIKANTYFGAVAAIQYPLLSIEAEKENAYIAESSTTAEGSTAPLADYAQSLGNLM